jgi:hypothetical protein
MAKINGKIVNPTSIHGEVISEIETPINLNVGTDMNYQASSLSTFLETESALFLPTDLSNIDDIFILTNPQKYGQSIFRNRLTEKTIPLYLNGNVSDNLPIEIKENNEIRYIDKGKKYQLLSSRNESYNAGWECVSNRALYNHIERSDFDSFDFPQVTIRGARKIPATTADTLCGPITYTGETYDRMNYNWFFGRNAGISFNPIISGGTPLSLSGAMISQEGVASISNREGKILFYTNGETVYTSGNTIMSNGTGLSSSGTSTQSSIIVPKPNTNKYYIFTTDYNGSPNGFEYSIVNMDLQGGDGQVETKNIKLINSPLTEKVTACSHSNGEDYWVITHTSGDTSYYSYKVSSAGLSGPVISNIGSVHNTARGYMKTSPDCSKLISLIYDENVIDIFDFESSAGTLSNSITITGMTFDVGPYGLEFSSDSSKFYVSEGAGEKVYQFDLTYTSSTEILNNVIEVGNVEGSNLGALQLAPDERIYVADYDKTKLHVIHRPNGLGVQCNFETEGYSLNKGNSIGCPVGFDLNPDDTMCFSSTTTSVTVNGTVYTAYTGNVNTGYNLNGTLFYFQREESEFPLQLTGTSSTLRTNDGTVIPLDAINTTSPLWDSLGTTTNGRLNNVGVWGTPATSPNLPVGEWIVLSFCLDIDVSGTYLIGISADNRTRFRINGELIFTSEPLTPGSNADLGYWRVFEYELMSGQNIIQMEGINDGVSPASFGCEVYSGTVEQISGYTTESQLEPHILFSTKNYRYETNGNVVKLFDLGESSGYSCPTGYTLDNCSDTPFCRKTIYTATTFTGQTSLWGLPNGITDKSISCDRYVYVVPRSRTGYLFDVLVNNVNDVVIPKNLSYFGEVYKYDQSSSAFTTSALQKFNIPHESLTANTGNTVFVSTANIGEGEFLIKSYWGYNVNTLMAKQQKVSKNTVNTYKRGELYGLYVPETDWYFISLLEAEKPLFNNSIAPAPRGINSLRVVSVFTESGKTDYSARGLSDPIVSYNGSVLMKNVEYTAITSSSNTLIRLSFDPLDKQVLTYAYVYDGKENDFYGDTYKITSTIKSGATNTQLESDRVFYNTTQNKYEFYLVSTPQTSIILTVNGSVLANNIEYFKSSSNSRRIILEENLNVGDVVEAFYVPLASLIGGVPTNSPTLSWSINSAPDGVVYGKFTVEVTDPSDIYFDNVEYTFEVDYVTGQKTYSKQLLLTNAKAGDKFIYRVKNEKFYDPIMGETIYSVSYSDTTEIEILFNSGGSY